MKPPALHALLVGIDAYAPPPPGGGVELPPLRGCVADVRRMRRMLLAYGVPAERVVCLTAPAAKAAAAEEAGDRLPTRRALLDALLALAARARPGDQALVHFSGHGARPRTAFGDDKGNGARHDEALVPYDGAGDAAALLRDVELAFLLKRFVERRVFVTLVLDCCHSGGAGLRGAGAVRNAAGLAGAVRPLGDGLAGYDELVAAWRWWWRPDPTAPRAWLPSWVTGDSGWLPLPRGYVLVAACGHDEEAHEIDLGGGAHAGALTHRLLAVLEQGQGSTYRRLGERLRAAFAAAGPPQRPQVEGEVDRVPFGGALPPAAPALRVLAQQGRRLRVEGGAAHGLYPGARLRVHPAGATGHPPDGAPDGGPNGGLSARATTVAADESAVEVRVADGAPVPSLLGARVTVDDPGGRRWAVAVAPPPGASTALRRALAAVAGALGGAAAGRLRAAAADEPPEATVTADADGFVVLGADERPLPHLPPLAADAANASAMVDRLVHLARYRQLERLANPDPYSALAGRLEAVLAWPPNGPAGRAGPLRPLPSRGGVYQVLVGEQVCLAVHNRSRRTLYLALFDLCPDWSVARLLPVPDGGEAHVLPSMLGGGGPALLKLRPWLPAGLGAGRGLLKVVATVRPTPLDGWTLPPLGEPWRGAEALDLRDPDEPPGDGWTTAEAVCRLTRRPLAAR